MRSCRSPVVWENPCRSSSDVWSSAAQFTAFESFRKIALSIDSCASTIEEFTLCAYSPSVVDTLAWRSRPWNRFRILLLINKVCGQAVSQIVKSKPLSRL